MQTIERLRVQNDNIEVKLKCKNITDLLWVVYDLFDGSIYTQDTFQPPEEEEVFGFTVEPGVYQLVCSCHCDSNDSSININVTNKSTGQTVSSSASNDGLLVYTAKRPFIVPGDEG